MTLNLFLVFALVLCSRVFSRVPPTPPPGCPYVLCSPGCEVIHFLLEECPRCLCKDLCGGCPLGSTCKEVAWGCENPPPNQPCDQILSWKCQQNQVCLNEPCAIRCAYGLRKDANGCQLCECLPNPCNLIDCLPGLSCKPMLDKAGKYPPYVAQCGSVCLNEPCGIRCAYGLRKDANGCQLCECLPNPCNLMHCLFGQSCKPVLDKAGKYPPFVAQCDPVETCLRNCASILCIFGTQCCLDEKGCYGCRSYCLRG